MLIFHFVPCFNYKLKLCFSFPFHLSFNIFLLSLSSETRLHISTIMLKYSWMLCRAILFRNSQIKLKISVSAIISWCEEFSAVQKPWICSFIKAIKFYLWFQRYWIGAPIQIKKNLNLINNLIDKLIIIIINYHLSKTLIQILIFNNCLTLKTYSKLNSD